MDPTLIGHFIGVGTIALLTVLSLCAGSAIAES